MTEKVYRPGEKAFVYQGPLLYDAKILKTFDPVTQKVESFDEKKKEYIYTAPNKKFPQRFLSEVCYLVHYQGWNAKWDEWVLPSRILEVNNENLMLKENLTYEMQEQERLKQKALEDEEEERRKEKERTKITIKLTRNSKQVGDSKGKSSRSSEKSGKDTAASILSIINGNGNNSVKSKMRNDKSMRETEESKDSRGSPGIENRLKRKRLNNGTSSKNETIHYESKTGFTHYEMKTFVPDALKIILVDDWENITKNNKLVSLPGKCPVSKTLDDFKSYLKQEFIDDISELEIFLEMTESIKLYFEQCLGTFLLYRYERPQYSDILDKEQNSHLYDIYPSIFLLRLLSIFPNILVMNNVDPGTVQTSKVYLDLILFWLDHNKSTYLVDEYENQSPWIALMQG